jgi:osmotically-inducible protein OsmY
MKADIELEREILDALRLDPSLDHRDIGVTVKEGVVKLRGTVPSAAAQWEAERIASRVEGVKSVINHLEAASGNAAGRG